MNLISPSFLFFVLLCSFGLAQTESNRFNSVSSALGFPFGTYHTIEGRRIDFVFSGTRTLQIDTIDGKKLEKPIQIWVENIAHPGLPDERRIILKGYESGRFVGSPSLPKEETEKWGS